MLQGRLNIVDLQIGDCVAAKLGVRREGLFPYVMGDRGTHNEKATGEDIARMAAIVRDGIEAGALGFTTSRTELHTTREDEAMPGTYADEAELLGIGRAIGELGGRGIYGVVSDWNNWEQEMDWMKRLSIENNCQINFVLFFRESSDWPVKPNSFGGASELTITASRLYR